MIDLLENFRYHRSATVSVQKVGHLRDRIFTQLGNQFVERFFVPVHHDDCAAIGQKLFGRRQTNTRSRAGDDSDLACQ
ncbi:hypothetical protein D3C80_2056310 [compost metagenome]